MMNYEIFKEVVAEKFKEYLPEELKGMEVSVREVEKVNRKLDGINLVNEEPGSISPTVYINDMYEQYKQSENLDEVLSVAANRMKDAMKDTAQVQGNLDFETAKDNIAFQLINTEQNKEMLRDMPNRSFQDLSIIYRWIVKTDVEGIQSTVIHNFIAEKLGISEEQMFKLAVENTRRIFQPTVKTMNDLIRDIFVKDGMPTEIADMMVGEMPPKQTMWIISNEKGINGAISMLYEDVLFELASKLESDLYIMPASVHEVIAVSAEMGKPEDLAQIVADINITTVEIEDRLSNQVYHYDKDLRKLSLATNTPNKIIESYVI